MLSSEGYEKFKEERQDSKVYDVKSLLHVGETMQFYEEQTVADRALNIGKSIYNGAVSQTVGDALHGLQALRDYNEAILNEEAPERMQMSEEARSVLDTAVNAEFLQPYEVRADSGAERLVYDLAQGGGQILGQVAVGALTGGYGNLPAMGLQIAGNEYKQLREQGVDVKTAAEAGAFNALVQTPLEYIGFKKITKAFPANTLFKQRLRMFAEDAVTEGITEFLQEYPEQASIIWAMQHKGEPLKDTDTMVREILQTAADNFDKITPDALYSGTIGAVLGSGAGGVHMALDRNITRTMEREAHNIRMEEEERRIEKIKESKVNPPYAAAVINDNMQGETVYVDGEALNAYAQAHDVQKVAEVLGVTVDDIQAAAENGDTVDVKLGNFEATGAAFDGFFQAVRDDTAFEDGGYTVNKDKLEQERDKAEEKQRDEIRVEQDRLLDEMKKAGVNSTTAANAVALITSRAINTNNPVEMMKQLSFRYGGDGTQNEAARYNQEVATQKEQVRQQFQNTDAWMKAPNGQQTRLDEDSWLSVRTPAFKAWFGDWENDAANASKVVDENGEPLVVYHGTDETFDTFMRVPPKHGLELGDGFYFTPDRDLANSYGGNTLAVFLNIKNPFYKGAVSTQSTTFPKESREEALAFFDKKQDDWEKNANGYARFEPTVDLDVNGNYVVTYATSYQAEASDENDGIITKSQIVVFDSNQIKSATDNSGAFDINDPNIYHQFAGKNAETADTLKLNEAQRMEAEGATAEDIYKATGWFKGKDNEWRFEIPDNLNDVNFDTLKRVEEVLLARVYYNEALFDAYPFLRQVKIGLVDMKGETRGKAYGNSKIELNKNYIDEQRMKSTLIHEIQHLIQNEEGFATGGNLESAKGLTADATRLAINKMQAMPKGEKYLALLSELEIARENAYSKNATQKDEKRLEKAQHEVDVFEFGLSVDELIALQDAYLEVVSLSKDYKEGEKFDLYWRLGGEQEARDAASRAELRKKLQDTIEAREDWESILEDARKNNNTQAEKDAIEGLKKARFVERLTQEQLKRLPQPHKANAIIVFDGKQMPYIPPTQTPEAALESFLQSAWHGSPHRFTKFDLGAIGTGEGAQVHGWGLYFAQDRKIAEQYKESLDRGASITIEGNEYRRNNQYNWENKDTGYVVPNTSVFELALTSFSQANGDVDKAINSLQKDVVLSQKSNEEEWWITNLQNAIKFLQRHGATWKLDNQTSQLYQVEIPDNDVLLDEQKTLAEQPEKIQKAAREIIADRLGNKDGVLSYVESKHGKELADKIREHFSDGKSLDYKEPIYKDGKTAEEHAKDYYDENGEFDPLKALLSEEPVESGESLREEIERLPDGEYILARIKLNDIASQSPLKYNEFWVERAFNTTGLGFYKSLSSFLGSDRSASELLNKYGIEGITYEGGRDGRCYVVFDDAAIKIIDTYNKQVNEGGALVNKGEYSPSTNVITLFKGADASTVIHETWHFFVEQMWNSLQDGTASKQTQKDFDALLKYAGMTREEWANADTNGRRAAHEKLAEAGETYIMEGRAPSYDLRRVFKNFAKWLKNVYRVISRSENAAELTDEVREVFDRMLAVEDDIARMERVNGYFAKLPDVITDNMSDETRMKVEDFIEKARDKAVGILTRRALTNYTKKRREEVQKFKDEIRPSVEAEVNNMPVYACGYTKKDVEKYNKLKEQQAGIGVWAAEDFIERAFPAEGPYGDELKNELALTAMFRSHDNWGKGLRELRAEYEAQAQEILKPALDVLESGMGQGVDIIKDEETGRYIRASRNAQWYRDFYKEHKRKPNKGELREMARLLIAGDVNAPQVEGWTPSTEEEAQAMQAESERLAEIERHIAAADAIKDKLVEIEKNYKATNGGDMFLLEAEVTAEQYGYSSADEMMKDIEASPTKEGAIRQRVNERVQELSPENERAYYENAVRESLYNEDEALLIGVEQQLIEEYAAKERAKQTEKDAKQTARAIEKQREDEVKAAVAEGKKLYAKNMAEIAAAKRQQAKNAAKEDLAKMNVKDATRTSKFITAERKAAIKSAQLLLKKDYAGALAQKNLQAYWHAMAAESIKVARRKAQYDKFLKTQQKAKPEAWLNETHFAAVSSLFVRMGIARPIHRQAVEQSELRSLADYAELMKQQFDCVDIAEWILDSTVDISDINALTLEEYEDVINAIKNIRAIVKAQKGVNTFNRNETWENTKALMIDKLSALRTIWTPNPNKPTRATAMERWTASMETLDTFLEFLDDATYGFFSKTWGNLIKQSADHEFNCLEAYNKADADAIKKWLPDKAAEAAAAEEVYYDELGTSATKHTLVKMLINLGNKENSQRLCETVPVGFESSRLWIMPDDTMGVSREEAASATRKNLVDFLGRVLTREDVEYAQRKINAAEMFWGEKNELEKRTKGFSLKKVEATPVVLTINGEQVVLQGGYFPLMRNGETGSHAASAEVQDDDPLQGKRIRTYHTNTSATKARTRARYPVNLFPGAETQWIYESIHDLCWRETMSDFRRVLNDQELFGLLKSKIGAARMNVFKEMLEVSADPKNSKSWSEGEKMLGDGASWLRQRTSHALIMMNLKVIMQNYANAFLYGNAVEGYTLGDSLKALGTYMLKYHAPGSHKEMVDFVTSKSAFMRERSQIPDITVRDIIDEKKEFVWEKASREIGIQLMAFTDNATAMPNWIQAYNKKINEGVSEQEAIDYADTIVRRVLGSSRITDVASMQRGGPLHKLLTMFQSFFNARFNEFLRMERYATKQWTMGEKQEAFATAFSYVVSKWLGQTMLAMALALQNPFGVDDKDKYPELLKELKGYTFSMMGPYGQLAGYVVGMFAGMNEFDYRMSAIESTVNKMGRAGKTLWSKNATKQNKAEQVIDTITLLGGVPAQFNRIFWNLFDAAFNNMSLEIGDIMRRRPKKERKNKKRKD